MSDVTDGVRKVITNRRSSYIINGIHYRGAYGKMVARLKELRRGGRLTDDEYESFRTLLEQVLREARGEVSVVKDRDFDKTSGQNVQVLPAFGVAKLQDPTAVGTRLGLMMPPRRRVELPNEQAVALLGDPSFNARDRNNSQADLSLILYAFRSPQDLIGQFSIDQGTMSSWLQAIAAQYSRVVPYHNWMHALDVFQFSHMSLMCAGIEEYLTTTDVLVILLAALAHDVGHPGTTNPVLVTTKAKLALIYNDRSPLENMHASVFFQTLQQTGLNFLVNMDTELFSKFRAKVIDVILATDMVHHFVLRDKMAELVSKCSDDGDGRPLRKEASSDDRKTLIQCVVHMADISNGCRPWDVNKYMVMALEEEMFAQGDSLSEMGLPCMPMMDRSKDSLAVAQDFFLAKLVLPLLDPYCSYLSDHFTAVFQANMEDNRKRWQALVEKFGKKPCQEILVLEQKAAAEGAAEA